MNDYSSSMLDEDCSMMCLQVHVHELGCENYSKCYVFKGTKDVTAKQFEVGACHLYATIVSLVSQ